MTNIPKKIKVGPAGAQGVGYLEATLITQAVKKGSDGHRVTHFKLSTHTTTPATNPTYQMGITLTPYLEALGHTLITGRETLRVVPAGLVMLPNASVGNCALARVNHTTPSAPVLELYEIGGASPDTCNELDADEILTGAEFDLTVYE